ncbi:MAG TPA: zinc ribbon domain-containing protein [Stellaceae bacterium]|nr:zinc ribbon domain-containing protein [Stellaceae bacterium]
MDGAERAEKRGATEKSVAAETVPCPYCAEDIKPAARVCKHCGRDFFLLQPLLEQVRALGKRIEEIEQGFTNFAEDTKQHVARIAGRGIAPTAPVAPWVKQIPAISRKTAVSIGLIWVMAADYLTNFVLDRGFGWIELAIVVGPFVGGFLCRKETKRPLLADLFAGAMLGIVAAFASSYLSMKIAHSQGQIATLLPGDAGEWREAIFYVLAIVLGFMGGAFARRVFGGFPRRAKAERDLTWDVSSYLVRMKLGGNLKPAELETKIKSLESMLTSLLAIGTTAAAILAAFGKILTS